MTPIIRFLALLLMPVLSLLYPVFAHSYNAKMDRFVYLGDSLRMRGRYPEALDAYRKAERHMDRTKVDEYSMYLDGYSILLHYVGNYHGMLDCLRRQLELKKPDSLLFRDGVAYISLADFYNQFYRPELGRKYTDRADSVLRIYGASNPDRERYADLAYMVKFLQIQYYLQNEEYDRVEPTIREARKYALNDGMMLSLREFEAKYRLALKDTAGGMRIFAGIAGNDTTTFDHQAQYYRQYIYLLCQQKQYRKARELLDSARRYASLPDFKMWYAGLMSDLEAAEGDSVKAYRWLAEYVVQSDSLENTYNDVSARIESDIFEQQLLQRELDERRREGLHKTLWIVGLVLLVVGGGAGAWWLYRRRKRIQRVTERMLGDRSAELSSVQLRANSYGQTCADLREILGRKVSDARKVELFREALREGMPGEGPRHIDLERSDEVARELTTKLSLLHPDLTNAELRMAQFVMMNLSNKEIAEMLHRSPSTVKYTKYSLRKKLGIEIPTEDYLRQVSGLSDEEVAARSPHR